MTRTEEILSDISDRDCNHFFCQMGCENKLSPKKLASYLATLESSKDEDKERFNVYKGSLTNHLTGEVMRPLHPEEREDFFDVLNDSKDIDIPYVEDGEDTPPSEEKKCCEKCLQYGGNGTAQAVAVAYCSKPDCPCHSPTQEEKKCLRCKLIKMGGEDKPVYHPPHTCSPTPPDAWETSQDYKQAIFAANKALDNPHIDPDGDISTIARQFLRMIERYAVLKEKL